MSPSDPAISAELTKDAPQDLRLRRLTSAPRAASHQRPQVTGKFLSVGGKKLLLRGVTYGTFQPNADGFDFPDARIVERDFAAMSAAQFNALRVYTVPPRWLLDLAHRHGLYVMVGLPWEQHITFLDDQRRMAAIEDRLINEVRTIVGHPAILAYAIGNEIPAPIVRWHGHRRVERYLARLYTSIKKLDPEALVTYVNYPTTEYLDLPFIDFVTFNVYLESEAQLRAYLARLQNIAGDRPLVLGEVGLDSRRNGEAAQADALQWQIRTIFAGGCAGTFVFAWTDQWHRGGFDVEDWDFGLTTRERRPKAALQSVRKAYSEIPIPRRTEWPSISVVVCSYNGRRTLGQCLATLKKLRYPNCEVIIVNDGSTDSTEAIAKASGFRVISTANHGLSSARNVGWRAAKGEIVAYIDDDAYPDRHWLEYLAHSFVQTSHAAIGGPNIPPAGDGPIADCVARAPGGPVHVLLNDEEAEHIPGCNMAFRRSALLAIGGFDETFRAAGDDVDVCWRVQEKGFTIGYHPGALVWHHRRNSLWAYWKQQVGYGKAEALLEKKWPEKYNAVGHVSWGGRVYGNGHTLSLGKTWRIYYGLWGTAPFQARYETYPGLLLSLPLMPEWYLVILALGWLTLLGTLWPPLLLIAPLFLLSIMAPIAQAILSSKRAWAWGAASQSASFSLRVLTTLCHVLQPLARLRGRLQHDLTLWRKRGVAGIKLPRSRCFNFWSEQWRSGADRLHGIKDALRATGASITLGHDFADWDIEIRNGTFGAVRARTTTEEHGAGRQLLRLHCWPVYSRGVEILALLFFSLSCAASLDQSWIASSLLMAISLVLALTMFQDCATATAVVVNTLKELGFSESK